MKGQSSSTAERVWNLSIRTHHLHGAIFRVVEQLVSSQQSSTGVVPLSQKGKAFLLCITQQTQQNTQSSQAQQENVTDLTSCLDRESQQPRSDPQYRRAAGPVNMLSQRFRPRTSPVIPWGASLQTGSNNPAAGATALKITHYTLAQTLGLHKYGD